VCAFARDRRKENCSFTSSTKKTHFAGAASPVGEKGWGWGGGGGGGGVGGGGEHRPGGSKGEGRFRGIEGGDGVRLEGRKERGGRRLYERGRSGKFLKKASRCEKIMAFMEAGGSAVREAADC